jgi:cobalt-precorrin 5A hydrolase/precorrin-3B C17-methyltransferase
MPSFAADRSKSYVLGLGCERGTPVDEVRALAKQAMEIGGIGPDALAAIASIGSRSGEPAILTLSQEFQITPVFFAAARLEQETPRLKNPSAAVFALVGCHGVAESAALAAAGGAAELLVPKIKSAHATAAIARVLLQKE